MKNIVSKLDFENFIEENEACLFYLSTPTCNVCKVLKPKLIQFIESEFPKIKMAYVDTAGLPDIAAQNSIFTVPTILVFLDGKEFLRKSRNINLSEFSDEIERPYSMYFNE